MSESITDDDAIERFEYSWEESEPEIDEFVPEEGSESRLATLLELVIIDLEFRWKQSGTGDSTSDVPDVETYVKRYPELGVGLIRDQLIDEEFTIRRKYGDAPPLDFFVERFPDRATRLGELDAEVPIGTSRQANAGASRVSPIIDHYTLIREVGEGGMGSVFLARQDEPVRRKVAIKVIRQGLDSREVIARFEAERQALAMMDHQNIARVYEAGTTDQGQPFFAMEYVDGIPITDYCRESKVSIPDRLTIFCDVCAAVQHAHQKGILHRDLKPSNVLIAEDDGHPLAKVIDFGLAKAVDSTEHLTDQSIYTHAGQVLGTLKYMSPEQAATGDRDVDTRADVYALGVMLYELLTGATPLDEAAIQEHGVLTILELIRDHEPLRPSVRLNANAATSQVICTERATTSIALRQLLEGDLDWVVMKPLEKDRDRRYESASSLADDVRRFLNDEPVVARPPSASYRLQKFARKNRILVSSAVAMLLLLFAGIGATTWQAVRATRAENEATKQTEIAIEKSEESERRRNEADQLREKERAARVDSDAAAARAEKIVEFVVDSYHSADPTKGARKDMLARDVLVQALAQVEAKMDGDAVTQAALFNALASSLYGLGDYQSSGRAAVRAIQQYRKTVGVDHDKAIRAINLLGNVALAEGHAYKAWELYSDSLLIQQGQLPGVGSWSYGLPWQTRGDLDVANAALALRASRGSR